MNDADSRFLFWLNAQINTGAVRITVPAYLLAGTTEDGRTEARRLAKLAWVIHEDNSVFTHNPLLAS